MWRLAKANDLDLNSPYYYLAFSRDFAATSVVATADGDLVGFVTGYRRPADRTTLFVWQVAVDHRHRQRGLGMAMLAALRDRLRPSGVRWVEATVTPSNRASAALFRALGHRSAAPVVEDVLFTAEQFPAGAGHQPEVLVRIGPFDRPFEPSPDQSSD